MKAVSGTEPEYTLRAVLPGRARAVDLIPPGAVELPGGPPYVPQKELGALYVQALVASGANTQAYTISATVPAHR